MSPFYDTQKRYFIYISVSATQGEPSKSPSDYYVNTLPSSVYHALSLWNKQDWMHEGSFNKKKRALIWKQPIVLFGV